MTSQAQRRLILFSLAAGLIIVWIVSSLPSLSGAFVRNAGFLSLNRAQVMRTVTGDDPAPELIERSINRLERATGFTPGNFSAWRALGYLLLEQGKEEEALSAWRHIDTVAAELFVNGSQAESAGADGEALDWYQRAVAVDPELIDGWLAIGSSYERIGDADSAIAAYLNGLNATPTNSDLFYYLGRAQSRVQQPVDWEAVLALADQAISHDNYHHRWSRFQSHYIRGEALRNLGRIQEALAAYTKVLEGYPDDYWPLLRRAELTWELGQDMRAAEAYYRIAIAIDPDSKWAYRHFARDLAGMGRLEEARAYFETVLALDPNDQVAADWLRQRP